MNCRVQGEKADTARSLPLSISLSLQLTASERVDVEARDRQRLALLEPLGLEPKRDRRHAARRREREDVHVHRQDHTRLPLASGPQLRDREMLHVAAEVLIENVDLQLRLVVAAAVSDEEADRGVVQGHAHRWRSRLGTLRELERLLSTAEGVGRGNDGRLL